MRKKISIAMTLLVLVCCLYIGTLHAYPTPNESVNIYTSQYFATSNTVYGKQKVFGAENYSWSQRNLFADAYKSRYIDGTYYEDTSRLMAPGESVNRVFTPNYYYNYYWYLALDPQGNYNGCRGYGAIWWAQMP